MIASTISCSVTPLRLASAMWERSCSGRLSAMSAATVMRLRSRFASPGRSQYVAEQDAVRQFGKLGRYIAHQLLGTGLCGGR